MLNLRYLATFLVVVRTGSLRGAAAERGLSPATVSHQIQRLEADIGAPVLLRGARCRPSPVGARLLPHAESLLRVNARAMAAVADPQLHLGAASNIGIYLLPPVLRRLRQGGAVPACAVSVADNATVTERLEEGAVDLALLETWQERAGFDAVCWRDEPLVVIVPPGHPWALRQRITADELAGSRLLAGEPGTGTGRLLRAFLARCEGGPAIAGELGSTEAVKRAVAHGEGISLVLAGTVDEEVTAGRLAAIPLAGPGLSKPLWAVWRRGHAVPGRDAVLASLQHAA
ncbi:LysR family transcriptional regulator [Arhodomonas aquaeolei]|uniref:LysR family transcriptional regulator n=1 Tax=Arhodomonas aquaeolei TaxID=2369 RepID=UPI0003804ABE|nr:LysR substrate-binding domain-containing protein [Arhodomonas aquaeolei]